MRIVKLLCLYTWMFILPAYAKALQAGPQIINVKDYCAIGDGIADDTKALKKAISAANGRTVYFPGGTYFINDNIQVKDPDIKLTANGAIIISNFKSIIIKAASSISGITFNNTRLQLKSQLYGLEIRANKFTGKHAIYGESNADNMPQNIVIKNNEFNKHSYGVYGCFSNSTISYNTFTESRSRNIELWGGSNNKITNNTIISGITGICHLIDRQFSKGCFNDVISNNTISDIKEEAISFDIRGNSVKKTGSVATGKVLTATGGADNNTLVATDIASWDNGIYQGLYFVLLSGKSKGKIYNITAVNDTFKNLTLNGSDINLQTGDQFVIIIPNMGHIVQGNIINNAVNGISLWGGCFNMKISDNQLSNSLISVKSLFGLLKGSYGPSFGNQIINNTLKNSNLIIGATTYNKKVDILSSGNVVEGNKITNGKLSILHQQ